MYQVIIVEDDPMVAAINKQYTEVDRAFKIVSLFKNGLDALDYLKTEDVDLVILDFYTPHMNGMEFIDQLHGMGKAPAVIMVTSANDIHIVNQLMSRGIVDYLVKPFEYSRFKMALDKFQQTRKRLEATGNIVNQETIDQFFVSSDQTTSSNLTKGLNEATLNLIREFLKENSGSMYTSEQIAEQIHLSRITIRRYMNYMTEINELISTIDYQTGGRPSIKYRYIRQD